MYEHKTRAYNAETAKPEAFKNSRIAAINRIRRSLKSSLKKSQHFPYKSILNPLNQSLESTKYSRKSKPEDVLVSTLVPLYVWFKLSEEYFVFPAFSFTLSPNLSDILDR